MPTLRKFQVGDYVYTKRQIKNTLDITLGRVILRVKEIKPSGLLLLQGKDMLEVTEMARNCAPCHLPVDGTTDPTLARIPAGHRYTICGQTAGARFMLLYDHCQRGYHTYCLDPPLAEVPEDPTWTCPRCRRGKVPRYTGPPRIVAADIYQLSFTPLLPVEPVV